MSGEVYSLEQIKTILIPIFIEYGVVRAVLFGSYGKGSATSQSDVDILVESNLKGLRFVGLIENVRTALNKDIDLFDVSHIEENSRIEEEIKQTGVLIYEKGYPNG